MRFASPPCPKLQRKVACRLVPNRRFGTWWSLVLDDRSLACSAVGRSPCWRQLFLGRRGYALLITITVPAGTFWAYLLVGRALPDFSNVGRGGSRLGTKLKGDCFVEQWPDVF